jgi:hypothetical protein
MLFVLNQDLQDFRIFRMLKKICEIQKSVKSAIQKLKTIRK